MNEILKNAEMLEGLIEDLEVARTNYDESISACDQRKTKEVLRASEDAIREYFKTGADIIGEQEEKIATQAETIRLQSNRIALLMDALKWYADQRNYIEGVPCYLDPVSETWMGDDGERARSMIKSATDPLLSDPRDQEIQNLKAVLNKIIERKPVWIDGKEWRMEYQDCVRFARQALGMK